MNNQKKVIGPFRGRYRFLSNFWYCKIQYDGIIYPSAEHAYQAAKTLDRAERLRIKRITSPGDAKRYGRRFKIRPEWEEKKLLIMETILRYKFRSGSKTGLSEKLKETKGKILVELNTWHDNYWGVCICQNCEDKKTEDEDNNNLGCLLMKIRRDLLKQEVIY